MVCIGGGLNPQNESTICVEITAAGLNAAEDGWEERLYNWSMLKEVVDFRYTRVDLARDYLSGEQSIENVMSMYREDGFTCSVQKPKLRLEGVTIGITTPKTVEPSISVPACRPSCSALTKKASS